MSMTPERFRQLQQALRQGNVDDFQVWILVTALRGPDGNNNASQPYKTAITGVIRYKVMGLTPSDIYMKPEYEDTRLQNGVTHKGGYFAGPDTERYAQFRREFDWAKTKLPDGVTPHYMDHARQAFLTLGLKWTEVNL